MFSGYIKTQEYCRSLPEFVGFHLILLEKKMKTVYDSLCSRYYRKWHHNERICKRDLEKQDDTVKQVALSTDRIITIKFSI